MKTLLMNKPAISTKNTRYSARYPKKTGLFVISRLKTGNFDDTGNKDLEAESERLNKLVAKAPFCFIHKVRKFDVL
jgi:hypothetical protein